MKCLAFISLLLVVVAGCTSKTPPSSGSSIGVVQRGDMVQRVTISGQVYPKHRLDIKPPFNGYIQKMYVKIGDRLKRGDPIVTFSPSLSAGEVNFPVRAGYDGIVTQTFKGEGEYVTETGDQNPLVVRFEDMSEMYVLGSIPELDIAKVKVGQEALIRVSSLSGETFKGVVRELGLSARDKDRWGSSATEFLVRVAFKAHDPRLLPGMSTVMDVVPERRPNVLYLSHEYIQEDDKGSFVVTESGETKRITTGLQTSEAVEIREGLKEGDRIRVIDFLNLPALKE